MLTSLPCSSASGTGVRTSFIFFWGKLLTQQRSGHMSKTVDLVPPDMLPHSEDAGGVLVLVPTTSRAACSCSTPTQAGKWAFGTAKAPAPAVARALGIFASWPSLFIQ